MTSKRTKQCILALTLCGFLSVSLANSQKASKTTPQTQRNLSQRAVAQSLGWVQTKGRCDLCDGYYKQAKSLILNQHPKSAKQLPTQVTAYGPTTFRRNGQSVLTGGVLVTQPGRRITADRAIVTRDGKTSKVTSLTLIGHVHLSQYGKLVVAPYAHMNLAGKTVLLRDAVYHVGNLINIANKKSKDRYEAWGYAGSVHNPSQNVMDIRNGSYTTCSPLNPTWMISARHLHLDHNTGIGKAYSAVLRIHKIPVAYVPYLRFPIDNRRLSGFLIPSAGYSKRYGFMFAAPIYWNMAANYDSTFTPRYMTKRGFEFSDLSRYITQRGSGKDIYQGDGTFDLNFLPDDNEFGHYRSQQINSYSGDPQLAEYINKLRGYHNQRGFFAFNGLQEWNKRWQTDLHINYVTDPYYFRDLGTPIPLNDPDQLLNEFKTQYAGDNWNFSLMAQAYQTLHRIDEAYNPVFNQYQRLPEFDANAFYPDVWRKLNVQLSTSSTYFNFDSDFPTENNELPTPEGFRSHLQPGVSYTFDGESSYFTPQLYLDATGYAANFKTTDESPSRGSFDQTRALPIVALDSGLYFDRRTSLLGYHYIQTLEPRAFYLYVPYQNQSQYPDFDTQLLPFSYAQLFRLNRFTGYDRLENANQLSLGLTSRLLQASDAEQRLRANIGMALYFQDPKVGLPGVTPIHESLSPLVSSLTYNINYYWHVSGNLAWNFHLEHMNNAGADVTYSDRSHRLVDFGYGYVHDAGQTSLQLTNSTNDIHAGFAFPLHYRWSALAYGAYNIAQKHADTYYAGLQYDSCCWALRFIFDRHFTGQSPGSTPENIRNQYDNIYYLQLLLKGLGSVGNSNPDGLLRTTLKNYQDPFQTNY